MVVVLRERAHRLHIAALVSTVAHPLYYVQDYRKGHAKLCRHSGMTHFA